MREACTAIMHPSSTESLGQAFVGTVPATTGSPIIVLANSRNGIGDVPWLLHLSGYRAMVVPARLEPPTALVRSRPALIVSYLLPESSRNTTDTFTYCHAEYVTETGGFPSRSRRCQPVTAGGPRPPPDTSRYYLALSRDTSRIAIPFTRPRHQPDR